MQAHQHDIVYYGVVNLVHEGKIIGTIDVWRCRGCQETFCEDKRFGATDLAPEVGFPKIEPGAKWAALICTRNNTSDWTLTGVKPGSVLSHSCTPETKLEFRIGPDYGIEPGPASGIGRHRVILLENFVNAPVDVLTGKKHTTTTDAYQALGKPFSFTPPMSAAITESSKLELFIIASGIFFLTGLFTLLATLNVISLSPESSVRTVLGILTVASLGSGYMTFQKSSQGPLLGIATSLFGITLYTLLSWSSGIPLGGYVLYLLLAAQLYIGWRAWDRLRSLRTTRWHPLDMPAYG